MEKAYKGLTGYNVIKEDDRKHEQTHVILTQEEYLELKGEISDLKHSLEEEKKSHKEELGKLQRKYDSRKKVFAEQQADLQKKIAEANARAEKETSLNENLLRITKERKNAERGLQPKKEHPGYRFADRIMQTKAIANYSKRKGAIYAEAWTATLETPYDCTIPLEQIKLKIFGDLRGSEGIFAKLGIKYSHFKNEPEIIWKGSYMGIKEDPQNGNYLFDYRFIANPKTKLWEIQVTTTGEIIPIPDLM